MIPIPVRCHQRPTQGGLVVPWISLGLADGTHVLGQTRRARVETAFLRRICQICGEYIIGRVVFFVADDRLSTLDTGEPPMHPECAHYAAQACPMVNGHQAAYRSSPTRADGPAGAICPDPGCDCAGIIAADPEHRAYLAGRPAELWHAVWCLDYRRTFRPDGTLFGARIAEPLRIRPLPRPYADHRPRPERITE